MAKVPKGWHEVKPDQIMQRAGRGNVLGEWMRDDARYGVQVEVVPKMEGEGSNLKVNTWDNATDEYDYDNHLPDYHSRRAAFAGARKWMRGHRN